MKEINLKDLSILKKKDFNGTIKIIPTSILNQLKQIELPIKNFKIAVSNIADFLSHLNIMFDMTNKSVIAIDKFVFEKYFSRKQYLQYKEILKELNIITAVPYEDGTFYSIENNKSLQFRIHNEYLQLNDFTLLIFNKTKDMEVNIEYDGSAKMVNAIVNEELDYSLVFNNEIDYHTKNNTTLFSLYLRISKALSLTSSRYLKKGGKSNRVYHSFSNLSRITRKCFYTKFYNIDLKNSQPTMLVLYVAKNKLELDQAYKTVCEDGLFYEVFYDLLDRTQFKNDDVFRKAIKEQVYASIFFSFNTRSEFNKRFKELYLITWNLLKELNKKEKSVASLLQDTEAEIFNQLDVKASARYFTLFDAIYYNNKKDTEFIAEQIINYGIERGVKFTLSYE